MPRMLSRLSIKRAEKSGFPTKHNKKLSSFGLSLVGTNFTVSHCPRDSRVEEFIVEN